MVKAPAATGPLEMQGSNPTRFKIMFTIPCPM